MMNYVVPDGSKRRTLVYRGCAWQLDGYRLTRVESTTSAVEDETTDVIADLHNQHREPPPPLEEDEARSEIAKLHRENAALRSKVQELTGTASDEESEEEDERCEAKKEDKREAGTRNLDPFNMYSWGTREVLQIEAEWAHRLKSLRKEKDTVIEHLRKKVFCRDGVISDLEDAASLQLDTIRALRSELDEVHRKVSYLEQQQEEQEKLFRMQSARLRDNSATIANILKKSRSTSSSPRRTISWVDCPTLDRDSCPQLTTGISM